MPWYSFAHREQAKLLIKEAGEQGNLARGSWATWAGAMCPLATLSGMQCDAILDTLDPSQRIKAAVMDKFGLTQGECDSFVAYYDQEPSESPHEIALSGFDHIPVGDEVPE